MKTLLTIAVAMLASFGLINNAHAAAPLKGGLCWTSSTMPNEYGVTLHCEHLGEIKSTHEIYEKGFRVVSSTFVSKNTEKYFYIFIEERK